MNTMILDLFTRIEQGKHSVLRSLQTTLDEYSLKLLSNNSEPAAIQLRRFLQEFLGLQHLSDKQKFLRPELIQLIEEQSQEFTHVLHDIETHLSDPYKFSVPEAKIHVGRALELSEKLLALANTQAQNTIQKVNRETRKYKLAG